MRSGAQIFGQIRKREIVDLQIGGSFLIERYAFGNSRLPVAFIHNHSPCAVIQLEITAARGIQLKDHRVIRSGNITDQRFFIRIALRRRHRVVFAVQLGERLCRSGDRLLGDRAVLFQLLYETVMLHERMIFTADFTGDAAGAVRRLFSMEVIAVIELDVLNSVQPPHKVKVPVASSELAVGDDMVSEVFLLLHKLCDAFVLDACQLFL